MTNIIRSTTLLLVTLSFSLAISEPTEVPKSNLSSPTPTFAPVKPDLIKTPRVPFPDPQSPTTEAPQSTTTKASQSTSIPSGISVAATVKTTASHDVPTNSTNSPSLAVMSSTPGAASTTASAPSSTTGNAITLAPAELNASNSTDAALLVNATRKAEISQSITTSRHHETPETIEDFDMPFSLQAHSVSSTTRPTPALPTTKNTSAPKVEEATTATVSTKPRGTVPYAEYNQQADMSDMEEGGGSPIFLIAIFGCIAVVVVAVVGSASYMALRDKSKKDTREANESAWNYPAEQQAGGGN